MILFNRKETDSTFYVVILPSTTETCAHDWAFSSPVLRTRHDELKMTSANLKFSH